MKPAIRGHFIPAKRGHFKPALTKITELEIERNKMISKVRYKIEQYFGVTALHQGASRARFTTLAREGWDRMCQVIAFNMKRSYLAGMRKAVAVAAS